MKSKKKTTVPDKTYKKKVKHCKNIYSFQRKIEAIREIIS